MTNPPFIVCELPNAPGIISTTPPYFIGKVWIYKDLERLSKLIKEVNPLTASWVDNYAICITYYSSLSKLKITPFDIQQAEKVIDEMSKYYLNEVIANDLKKFKRNHI